MMLQASVLYVGRRGTCTGAPDQVTEGMKAPIFSGNFLRNSGNVLTQNKQSWKGRGGSGVEEFCQFGQTSKITATAEQEVSCGSIQSDNFQLSFQLSPKRKLNKQKDLVSHNFKNGL